MEVRERSATAVDRVRGTVGIDYRMQAVQTESVPVAATAATADSIRAETNGDRSRVQRKAIRVAEGKDAQPEDELGYVFESDPRKRKAPEFLGYLGNIFIRISYFVSYFISQLQL